MRVTATNPLPPPADNQEGKVFFNSQVEPHIAVNPMRPNNLVAGWQQDRTSTIAALGPVVASSNDSGATWAALALPATTRPAGGPYDRMADPWIAFSSDGQRVFYSALLGDFTNRVSAVTISRSEDDGKTWGDPQILSSDGGNDKETVTCDRQDPNLVYVVWHKVPSVGEYTNGDIFFSRSTDGGETYSQERRLAGFPEKVGSIGHQILSLQNGSIIDFFAVTDERVTPTQARLGIIRSTDKGQTWSEVREVLQMFTRGLLTSNGAGVRDPEDGVNLRAPGYLPSLALNLSNGEIYHVWQDTRFSAPPGVSPEQADVDQLIDEVAFSVSRDEGQTWSQPIKINRTPTNIPLLRRQAFLPTVAVAPDGAVVVTYYDFRNDTSPGSLGTDAWAVVYRPVNGPITDPESWSTEVRISEATFDLRQAPLSEGPGAQGGYFVGDYLGMCSLPRGVGYLFSQPSGGDPAPAFYRAIFTSP